MANVYGRVAKISNAVGRSSYINDKERQSFLLIHSIISDIIPPLSKLFIHSTYNFPGFSIYSFGILWSKAILIVSIKIKSKQTTV